MWKVDLEPGQSVQIGNLGTVTFEKKSGQNARLSFQVDKSVPLRRVEPQSPASPAQGGISPALHKAPMVA